MENIKIQIQSVQFFTEENKNTRCIVTYRPNRLLKRTVFYGLAIMHDGDTFDKKTGQRIAFAKAERSAYKHARKNAKRYLKLVKDEVALLENFYKKADDCFTHNDQYIKDLCGC